MTSIDRRSFISKSALTGGLVFAPSLMGLISCSDATSPGTGRALRQARAGEGGYGKLKPAKGLEGIISIPAGFHARILSTSGDPLDGGGLVPNAFDGMGAFAVSGEVIRLVRNHELRDGPAAGAQPFGPNAYDAKGPAGNTTLEVRVRADGSAEKLREFPSLTGTFTNCAGGTTPWGSWLSCEEATPGTLDIEGAPTGGAGQNFVRGLTRAGAVFDLVSNDLNGSEWAGACFSPQGRTIFASIQGNTRPLEQPSAVQAMTFAIWGPWESGAL